jgi:O-antigen ligase
METSAPAPTIRFLLPPRVPQRLWQAGIVAIAVLLGTAAAFRPGLAVAAVVAAAFVPLVLTKLNVGLCMLLYLSFMESLSGVGGGLSLTKLVGVLLVVGWLAAAATGPASERRAMLAREPLLGGAVVLFALWAAGSVVWADQPSTAASAVLRFALNFVLFPIVLAGIRERRHVVWVFVVFVAGSLSAMTLGIIQGTSDPAAGGRLTGAGLDANDLGELLVVAIILALSLAANRRWLAMWRLVAACAAATAAVGLFMTVSRGGLVGLSAAALVAPFAVGRGRRAAAVVLIVVALVGTVGWFATIAPAHAVERIENPKAAGGSGRLDLWTVGWRIVNAHPINGVGAGNFRLVSVQYLLRPGRTDRDVYIVTKPKVPHNIYLNVLAELGIVGLALFAAILALSLRSTLRAVRAFASRGDTTMELLTRGLFIALVGLLVCEFFSPALYSKQLWFLLALGPAFLAIARRGAREPVRRTPSPRVRDLPAKTVVERH